MTAVLSEIEYWEAFLKNVRNEIKDTPEPHSFFIIQIQMIELIILPRLKEALPIEKQDLQKAFEAGKDSKIFMVETEFEIQYDYLETFDQFYNELKGE